MPKAKKKSRNMRTAEYTPSKEESATMKKAMHAQQPKARQPLEQIVSVPSRIIEQGRSTSHHIIDTLAKTALTISNAENAVEKLNVIQSLWNMQKEAEDRQAEREFNTAKVLVAQDLPNIPKSGLREFVDKKGMQQSSDYSTLDDIEGVLDPICRRYGITKEYSSRTDAKGWAAQILTVRHVSGHKEVYESPYMPLDTSGSKNNNQGAGSTAKYGRRYAVIGAFNIFHVDEDADGVTVIPSEPKPDKFGARVQTEAEKGQPKGNQQLTLPEAAASLESKLRNLPVDKRAEALIKHIAIIDAMEKDVALAPQAAELRKLCEEKANESH